MKIHLKMSSVKWRPFCPERDELTHFRLVSHICVSEWGYPVALLHSAASHYLNQCWVIVNWTLRNKVQINFNQNTKLSFTKMHLKISSVKWRPFCPGGDELTLGQEMICCPTAPGRYLTRLRLRLSLFNKTYTSPIPDLHKVNEYTKKIYRWYIMNNRQVGRPPLRSYLTAAMEANRKGKACTAMMGNTMQLDVNWI